MMRDVFAPTLFSSESLDVSQEQLDAIKHVLDVTSSDSRFAQKAYIAIVRILTDGSVVVPTVSSLAPNSAIIGSPNFTLTVTGTGFTSGSIIVFNGTEEPTTFVSETELTTDVDMSTVSGPVTVPVNVLSAEGVYSNPMDFTFLPMA